MAARRHPRKTFEQQLVDACASGDTNALRALLKGRRTAMATGQWTALHEAAKRGYADAAALLLEHGASLDARESGDNTTPLHWAAAHRHNDVVKLLLDAGADVNGFGDVHELDAIGWATFFREPGRPPGDRPETARLLVERGARHHMFSAICLNDARVIRAVAKQDKKAFDRRMSRFEGSLDALRFAMSIGRRELLDVLIECGADIEAKDRHGLTPLETALLFGDADSAKLLLRAGAKKPSKPRGGAGPPLAKYAAGVGSVSPMIYVRDVAASLDWYRGIGFREAARFGDDNLTNFGIVALGDAQILINMLGGKPREHGVSLWFNCEDAAGMYDRLKCRQIAAALAGRANAVDFAEHINDTFYGARQFAIRDLDGYVLYFIEQLR